MCLKEAECHRSRVHRADDETREIALNRKSLVSHSKDFEQFPKDKKVPLKCFKLEGGGMIMFAFGENTLTAEC